MATNKRDLKAFVRYDGSGNIVPSSVILARKMPKVGRWTEIDAYECCNYVAPDILLLEDGGSLLQEDNGEILL
jgi:hypothetical protein